MRGASFISSKVFIMDWKKKYQGKLTTPEKAVKAIKSGNNVFLDSGCAQPELLQNAMTARAPELKGVKVHHLLVPGNADYTHPKYEKSFRHNAFFIGSNVREAVNDGRADYMPMFLHQVPGLFLNGNIKIDVALIQISPPDEKGYCTYGAAVDIVKAATETAKIVIAEINEQMPRTLGDTRIHMDRIHHAIPTDKPLMEFVYSPPGKRERKIGNYITSIIEDGSTIQVGIGEIPDATLLQLKGHKDLGICTEMFADGAMKLMKAGVITNMTKVIHKGKAVASFLLGSRKLYEWCHDNEQLEFYPSDYTNDPFLISKNPKMVAINSCIQIDLTGQVCSDSIGTRFYSGIGGQVDFMRGAAYSKGGKPIITCTSTVKKGTISRIVSELYPGGGVVTSRGDVHYVVTEYGIANLFGKPVRERAKALIDIAHPDFRPELEKAAKARKLL